MFYIKFIKTFFVSWLDWIRNLEVCRFSELAVSGIGFTYNKHNLRASILPKDWNFLQSNIFKIL